MAKKKALLASTVVKPSNKHKFFDYAVEYLIEARFAVLALCSHTAGILFHQSIEMALKAYMVTKYSLEDIKKRYRHGLKRLWVDFKADHPSENLSEFDSTVDVLDRFWNVRYPDEIFEHGAVLAYGWKEPGFTGSAPGVPDFNVKVHAIDRLLVKLASLVSTSVDLDGYMRQKPAIDVLEYAAEHLETWKRRGRSRRS